MIIVETSEVELSRPVRLIHPRWPLYVIPRGDNKFMLGATSIEAEDTGVSVRSALELLGAAYAVHPAFAEARIVEFGSGLASGLSRQSAAHHGRQEQIAVNGLYRHGFLLAPALAELTLGYVAARRDRQRGDAMRVTVNGEAAGDRLCQRRRAAQRARIRGHAFRDRAELRRAAEKPLGRDDAQERRRDRDHHAAAGRVM